MPDNHSGTIKRIIKSQTIFTPFFLPSGNAASNQNRGADVRIEIQADERLFISNHKQLEALNRNKRWDAVLAKSVRLPAIEICFVKGVCCCAVRDDYCHHIPETHLAA